LIRYLGWMLICIGCSGAAAAAPGQKVGPGPVCLYNSRSFSEGADICVQKSLMLTCASDGTYATWKPVLDEDLKERCTAPMTLNYPPRSHSLRQHAVFRGARPIAGGPAKCFTFNGKQYCE
jgi:hypothetical protein